MPLAIVKTNLLKENIPRDFMVKLSELLAKTFECNREVSYQDKLFISLSRNTCTVQYFITQGLGVILNLGPSLNCYNLEFSGKFVL